MNVIRAVKKDELRAALSALLGKPETSLHELHRQVEALISYASRSNLSLEHCLIAEERGKIISACLCVDAAGRNASIFLPNHIANAHSAECVVEMLERHTVEASERNIHLLQAMAAIDAVQEQELLARASFMRLTQLIYLERDVILPVSARLRGSEVSWEEYTSAKHEKFAKLVLETYEGSLDCAGLSGVRDIEDTLASHRATGEFDPHHWLVARAGEESLGVGLFARIPERSATEVVYMGLVPAARGRGFGVTLLRKAVSIAREQGSSVLTLTVDEQNRPARRLYAAFGFHETSRREVWMRILRTSS